jgi:hypothetical protein
LKVYIGNIEYDPSVTVQVTPLCPVQNKYMHYSKSSLRIEFRAYGV